jgi:hypothetical protein
MPIRISSLLILTILISKSAIAKEICETVDSPCIHHECRVSETNYPNKIIHIKQNTNADYLWLHFHGHRGSRPEIDDNLQKIINHSQLIQTSCDKQSSLVFPLSNTKNQQFDEYFIDNESFYNFINQIDPDFKSKKIIISVHSGAGRIIPKILPILNKYKIHKLILLDSLYRNTDIEMVQNIFKLEMVDEIKLGILAPKSNFKKLSSVSSQYSPYNRTIQVINNLKVGFEPKIEYVQSDQVTKIRFQNNKTKLNIFLFSDSTFDHWSLVPIGLKD